MTGVPRAGASRYIAVAIGREQASRCQREPHRTLSSLWQPPDSAGVYDYPGPEDELAAARGECILGGNVLDLPNVGSADCGHRC
jgi:hypothetical protein